MVSVTEPVPDGSFLLSSDGAGSFERLAVAEGQNLAAGEAVMFSGGQLVTWDGDASADVAGLMFAAVDARVHSKSGTYLARDCEVFGYALTYPDGRAGTLSRGLGLAGIEVRWHTQPDLSDEDVGGGDTPANLTLGSDRLLLGSNPLVQS